MSCRLEGQTQAAAAAASSARVLTSRFKHQNKQAQVRVYDADDKEASSCPVSVAEVYGYSRKGFMSGGGKEQNQDRGLIIKKFIAPGHMLFGVMDGHGSFGHLVSAWLVKHLPPILLQQVQNRNSCVSLDKGSSSSTAKSLHDSLSLSSSSSAAAAAALTPALHAAQLKEAFLQADNMLCGSGINVLESGSTAIITHVCGRVLTTAWVGDSRAVVGRQNRLGSSLTALQLSDDHKPDRADEKVSTTC